MSFLFNVDCDVMLVIVLRSSYSLFAFLSSGFSFSGSVFHLLLSSSTNLSSIIAMSSCDDGVWLSWRKAVLVASALISMILLSFAGLPYHGHRFQLLKMPITTPMEDAVSSSPHRKLLLLSNQVEDPTRIEGDIKVCSESDLVVNQGPSDPLPSGIPTYTVEITNACATGCDITKIHFSCGWFSSARLINPSLFKRVGYDDCVVNEGKSLPNGQTLSFQYANTYSYPLSVSTMKCL